jgi:uncharacterized Ntn-hydrolase superfamily protein
MWIVRPFLFCVALLAFFASPASATWSVIAVDRAAGTVVIASATCVPQAAFAGFPAKDQKLIFAEIQKGTAPADIIALLKADPRIASRQFAIVDLEGRSAGFSGERNLAVSLDRQGQVAGTTIQYSIQGNILTSEAVVTKAVDALVAATGSLSDRVMAAMEAADAAGGDSRCSCDRGPKINAPCTAKTSHVAYILEARKGDTNGASYNDGQYALYLSVTDQDIKPDENANPVRTLRMRYERWKAR